MCLIFKILVRWEALNIVPLRVLEAVNPLLAEGRERVYIIRSPGTTGRVASRGTIVICQAA